LSRLFRPNGEGTIRKKANHNLKMGKQISIIYLLFFLVLISIFFHNFLSGFFEFEEIVFFILTFVFFVLMVISLFYNAVTYFRKGEPKDIWKIGFLGLFCFLGPIINPGFYGFFGFFGFLGAKKWKK